MIKLITFLLSALSFASLTFALTPLPAPTQGYIVDQARIFQNIENINTELLKLKQETGVEMGIYTTQTLEGNSIQGVSRSIYDEWKIGDTETDNGLLLVIVLEDRKFRLETGYGMEGTIPDLLATRLLDLMTQDFRSQNYDQGVLRVIQEASKIISSDGGYTPPTPEGTQTNILELLFLLFIPFNWLGGILARSRSWWLGGILGAVFMMIFAVIGLAHVLFIFPAILIGLLFDYFVSRNYQGSKHTSWWAGGSHSYPFDRGRSSSSSFGGFGGGSSGGGGASGGW